MQKEKDTFLIRILYWAEIIKNIYLFEYSSRLLLNPGSVGQAGSYHLFPDFAERAEGFSKLRSSEASIIWSQMDATGH